MAVEFQHVFLKLKLIFKKNYYHTFFKYLKKLFSCPTLLIKKYYHGQLGLTPGEHVHEFKCIK